jgi:hypothetical protein
MSSRPVDELLALRIDFEEPPLGIADRQLESDGVEQLLQGAGSRVRATGLDPLDRLARNPGKLGELALTDPSGTPRRPQRSGDIHGTDRC